jgi:ectoine hydroxylase-related dioxygenase (phytanoyl-CoA dioxygenase family)
MDFVRLEPDQRQTFDENGFLIVRNALGADAVARVVETGDRLARSFLDKPALPGRPEWNLLDLRPGLVAEQPFLELVSRSTTVPLVVQLLSPNIHLHSTALIYKRPAPAAPPFRFGWHRDIRIPRDIGHDALPRVGIKVCYCLTDFPEPQSGMTLFVRGSHRRAEPLAVSKDGIDPTGGEVVDLQLKAGDALLFENRIFHTGAPNRSDRCSRVVMFGYAYRWMKTETYLEVPDAKLLSRADPVTRQLLGGYRDVDTPPWALQRWARRHGVLPETIPWTVQVREEQQAS